MNALGTSSRLIGYSCVFLSVGFLLYRAEDFQVVLASAFLAAICLIDTLTSRIPNVANASLAAAGLAFNLFMAGAGGLATSGLGMLAGLGLLLLPYLMGGIGAGDVKALAALGSLVGPWPILQIFVYMALCGGILGIIHYMLNQDLKEALAKRWISFRVAAMTGDLKPLTPEKTEKMRFPYAAAIALGYYLWLIRGDVL